MRLTPHRPVEQAFFDGKDLDRILHDESRRCAEYSISSGQYTVLLSTKRA